MRVAMRTNTAAPAKAAPSSSGSGKDQAGKSGKGRAARRDRKRGDAPSNKTVIKDEFLVEGKLEKPSAYYILRRSSLDYDWARLDAKFSPLVLESVQDPLF
jgi:hypothetical protein